MVQKQRQPDSIWRNNSSIFFVLMEIQIKSSTQIMQWDFIFQKVTLVQTKQKEFDSL